MSGAALQWDKEGRATARIPFMGNPHARSNDGTKDQRFINCFFEPIVDPLQTTALSRSLDYYTVKRPGTSQNINPADGAGTGRGFYYWPLTNTLYSIVGTQIYAGSTNLGVTLTTTTGKCGITETRPGATTPYLGINDGVKLYIISITNVVTTITTNFPTPNTTDLIFQDTYWFVLKTDGSMWSCNSDDPTTWNPANDIYAQMMAGNGVALARIANYTLLFTDRNIQYFSDAANPAGSPFSNVEQAMQKIGCQSNGSLAQTEDNMYWVGNGYNGEPTVWKLGGTTALNEIANEPICRILGQEGANLANATSMAFRVAGHQFYLLNLTGINRTLVYHDTTQLWCEWSDTTLMNAWPMIACAQMGNQLLVQHTTNGWIYNLSTTVYQDDSVTFPVFIRLGRHDYDTLDRKFCVRLDLVCDKQSTPSSVLIQYSDDDYTTFSTGRTFDVSLTRNFGRAWGNFRRRSWQLTHTANTPFRAWGLEVKLSLGL